MFNKNHEFRYAVHTCHHYFVQRLCHARCVDDSNAANLCSLAYQRHYSVGLYKNFDNSFVMINIFASQFLTQLFHALLQQGDPF